MEKRPVAQQPERIKPKPQFLIHAKYGTVLPILERFLNERNFLMAQHHMGEGGLFSSDHDAGTISCLREEGHDTREIKLYPSIEDSPVRVGAYTGFNVYTQLVGSAGVQDLSQDPGAQSEIEEIMNSVDAECEAEAQGVKVVVHGSEAAVLNSLATAMAYAKYAVQRGESHLICTRAFYLGDQMISSERVTLSASPADSPETGINTAIVSAAELRFVGFDWEDNNDSHGTRDEIGEILRTVQRHFAGRSAKSSPAMHQGRLLRSGHAGTEAPDASSAAIQNSGLEEDFEGTEALRAHVAYSVQPNFPTQASQDTGTVVVKFLVDEGGAIIDLRAYGCLDADMRDAAVAAARQWKFDEVGSSGGGPIVRWAETRFKFRPQVWQRR